MACIRLHPSGRTIESQGSLTILESLEKSGYALPNNCRAGACGECKVKVLEGRFDQGFVLDMALSAAERAQGYGLMCMAKPLSDEIVIEWGTVDAKPKLFAPRENLRYVVVDRIQRTPRIVELRLRPLGEPMRYWPGQYVTLGDADANIPQRSYSIASVPRVDGELVLQITPVLCMANGSGLAPILALAEAALRRGFSEPVTLLFSASTKEDLYDTGKMAWWEARHRNFRYRPTLTRQTPTDPKALKGRIPAVLPTLFKDLANHLVFIAGSPDFVDACKAAAQSQGAKIENIHCEGYYPQQGAREKGA
jgi:CDP-4-dehydro-6-deoxyglucose reductase